MFKKEEIRKKRPRMFQILIKKENSALEQASNIIMAPTLLPEAISSEVVMGLGILLEVTHHYFPMKEPLNVSTL